MSVLPEKTTDLTECAVHAREEPSCRKIPSAVFLTESGELRRIALADVGFVKPLNKTRVARLRAASAALGNASASQKGIEISAPKGGALSLGYIAETPVWRPTYRLILGDARSVLQGWALVHNDTDEAWKQVKLELVNGRPDSFLFPLAAPRYARRQLVTPDDPLSTVPQLLKGTTDSQWGDDIGESYGAGGLGLSGIGAGGGGRGEGIGLGNVGTVGHGAGVGDSQSSILDVGNLAAVATQEGVEAGAQFTYAMAGATDLAARTSALLPFVERDVQAIRIALFSGPGESARSAVRLQNESGQTLPAGTLAVFADGGLAGESAIARLKPKEVQFISFGLDLDVSVKLESKAQPRDETRYVSLQGRTLREHFVRHRKENYQVENRSGAARTVYLGLSVVENANVQGADRMDFDSRQRRAHAVFALPARSEKARSLQIDEGLSRSIPITRLSSRSLRTLASARALPESQRKVLRDAADEFYQAEIRSGAAVKRRLELATLNQDANRLREHARALAGKNNAEMVKRLLRVEDEIRTTRARIAALDSETTEKRGRAEVVLKRLPKR